MLHRFVVSGTTLLRVRPETKAGHTVRDFREHTLTVEAVSDAEASAIFQHQLGFSPAMIGSKEVRGHCEYCSRPIYAGEAGCWRDSEGVMLCREHAPEEG